MPKRSIVGRPLRLYHPAGLNEYGFHAGSLFWPAASDRNVDPFLLPGLGAR